MSFENKHITKLSEHLCEVTYFLSELIEFDFKDSANYDYTLDILLTSAPIYNMLVYCSKTQSLELVDSDNNSDLNLGFCLELYSRIMNIAQEYNCSDAYREASRKLFNTIHSKQLGSISNRDIHSYKFSTNFKEIIFEGTAFDTLFTSNLLENFKRLYSTNIFDVKDTFFLSHLFSSFDYEPIPLSNVRDILNYTTIEKEILECRLSIAMQCESIKELDDFLFTLDNSNLDLSKLRTNILLDMTDIHPGFNSDLKPLNDDNLIYLMSVLTLIIKKIAVIPKNIKQASYLINSFYDSDLPYRIFKAYKDYPEKKNELSIQDNLLLLAIIKHFDYLP